MPMKAELKEKWVAALRSREFKQGQGALKEVTDIEKNKVAHCCLGVLHEISGGKWHRDKYDDPKSEGTFRTGGNSTTTSASDCYLEGKFTHGLDQNTQKELAEMNDSGKKFYQIANWIEKNIPTK